MTTLGACGHGTLGYPREMDEPDLLLPTGNAVCHRIWQEVRGLDRRDGARVVFAELAGEIARLERELAESQRAVAADVPDQIAALAAHE